MGNGYRRTDPVRRDSRALGHRGFGLVIAATWPSGTTNEKWTYLLARKKEQGATAFPISRIATGIAVIILNVDTIGLAAPRKACFAYIRTPKKATSAEDPPQLAEETICQQQGDAEAEKMSV